MIDLLSTIIQLVSVAYVSSFVTLHILLFVLLTLQIVYLLYVGQGNSISMLSLIMIAAVRCLSFSLCLETEVDMIGWMIFYILAILASSFLPYFSSGRTHVVLGESGKDHCSCTCCV